MKTQYSEYVLTGKNSQPSQPGALLRIESEGAFGVADICPKPQFGDLALEEELASRGPLFQRAHELAFEDLTARKNKKSLLQDKFVSNNILLTGYGGDFEIDPRATYKIKGDKNFSTLLALVKTLPKVRIDFNSRLTIGEYDQFLEMLTSEIKNRIEYIEDPTELNAKWEQWNEVVPLAYDLQQNANYSTSLARYRVIKPSRQRLPAQLDNLIFTSAMDHPVGVAHGLRIAQKYSTREAGFLTMDLYEEGVFSRYFRQQGTALNFSPAALQDTGIGMTAELDAAEWKLLA